MTHHTCRIENFYLWGRISFFFFFWLLPLIRRGGGSLRPRKNQPQTARLSADNIYIALVPPPGGRDGHTSAVMPWLGADGDKTCRDIHVKCDTHADWREPAVRMIVISDPWSSYWLANRNWDQLNAGSQLAVQHTIICHHVTDMLSQCFSSWLLCSVHGHRQHAKKTPTNDGQSVIRLHGLRRHCCG